MKKYIIDGKEIKDIKSMCDAFAKSVEAQNGYFGNDLTSFDDCLFGGFGLDAPCEIIWNDSDESKKYLNEKMLIDYCEDILENDEDIHREGFEEGKKWVLESIEKAKKGELTMFDTVVDMINTVTERATWDKQIELILK